MSGLRLSDQNKETTY